MSTQLTCDTLLSEIVNISKAQFSVKPLKIFSQSSRSVVLLCEKQNTSSEETEIVLKASSSLGFVEREAHCLADIKHPNIVGLMNVLRSDKGISVLMERVPGRSVIEILVEEKRFTENETATISLQVAEALSFLHSRGWVHRDVKPDNLIYNRNTGTVKLIDFEFSCKYTNRKHLIERRGTLQYVAPEVRRGDILKGPEIDVWSLGVTLFVMVTGFFPFNTDQVPLPGTQPSIPIPANCSHNFVNLLHKMLDNRASRRLTIEGFKHHPWIRRESIIKVALNWFKHD